MARRSRQPVLPNAPRAALKVDPLRIKVVVPSHDFVIAEFSYCLASLCAHTVGVMLANDIPGDFGLGSVTGTYIHTARQDALQAALDENVTHLLWVDSDMAFPKDALIRLLKHNRPFVGINYSSRGLPPVYVAIKESEPGTKCPTTAASTGLEEVEAIGFGLALMDLRRIRPLLWEQPWFDYRYLPKSKNWVGEDVYFCRMLRAAGIPALVDHDLSKDCAHIGLFKYKLDHVAAWGVTDGASDHELRNATVAGPEPIEPAGPDGGTAGVDSVSGS